MAKEKFPVSWSHINMEILYKIGDVSDPRYCRGIALLNNLSKSFTSIILNRLKTWVENCAILPDEQNDSRAKRGCNNN